MASCEISPRQDDIKNDILIAEVEQRPGIYKKDLDEYSDASAKKLLWVEVCNRVFPGKWDRLTEQQKMNSVYLVQKRWKNIRACFAREVRFQNNAKSGEPQVKRRKYIYFDQLLFLLPNMDSKLTESNEEDEREDNVPEIIITENTTQKVLPRRTKQKEPSYEEPNIKCLQEMSVQEHDQDTYFALSLVPMLKGLPIDEKIDAQIRILEVFKSIRNPKSSVASGKSFKQRLHRR